MKHRFEIKMAGIFALVICVIIGSYFIAFRSIYDKHEYTLLADESIHTLQAMKQSCQSLLESADNYSKIMLADDEIQAILNEGDIYANPRSQTKLINRIYGLLQFENNIESIFFIDKKNQIFTVGGNGNFQLGRFYPFDTNVYEKIEKNRGGYILTLDSGMDSSMTEPRYISLIREYKNLEDFSYSGILSVNININAVRRMYRDSLNTKTEEILFLNGDGEVICQEGESLLDETGLRAITDSTKQGPDGTYHNSITISQKKYMASGVYMQDLGWTIIRMIPMGMKHEQISMLTMNVILVIASTILIILGTAFVSRMMTAPIQTLIYVMKQAEKGAFVKIQNHAFFYEFRYLFEGYNRLLDKVDQLLLQTIEKQKVIRRIELNEMHEQMKPHFLYNTLDSIEALAMMGEKEKLCDIVEALGDFYRKSVSKGREMITIQDEMTIVMDYIRIMSIRFENLFIPCMEVEDECRQFLIPKLTLQPIVENSIHHGLREREEQGHLWIGIRKEDEWMHISIADDGIGFTKELLGEMADEKRQYQEKSYGLRGTIERLRLVYGESFKYEVASDKFVMTDISFYIRLNSLEGERHGEIKGDIG